MIEIETMEVKEDNNDQKAAMQVNDHQLANLLVERGMLSLNKQIKKEIDKVTENINNAYKQAEERLAHIDRLLNDKPTIINTGTIEAPKTEMTHKAFFAIAKILMSQKRKEKNIMLVGPAGGGKSHLAYTVAQAAKLPFHPMSVGIQTTKSDLLGFINAMGTYVTSPVREAFEKGGILLLDEFDAANAGVVTILNGLLANSVVSFPDKVVTKHKNFICICACNTYGRGADASYVGRNRLDAATLDRFIVLPVDYDDQLEAKLTKHSTWLAFVRKMRANAEKEHLKYIISPRAAMDGADLLDAGFNIHDVLEMVIFKGIDKQIIDRLLKDIELPPRPSNCICKSSIPEPPEIQISDVKKDKDSDDEDEDDEED